MIVNVTHARGAINDGKLPLAGRSVLATKKNWPRYADPTLGRLIEKGKSHNTLEVWQEVAREIESFVRSHRNWPQVSAQGDYWVSDGYLLAKEFDLALAKFPNKPGVNTLRPNKREYLDTMYKQTTFKIEVVKFFRVKRYAEEEVKGKEVVSLGSNYALTDYGLKNIERLPNACEVVLDQRRHELGVRIIDHLMVDYGFVKLQVFHNTVFCYLASPDYYLEAWHLNATRTPNFILSTLTRTENIIRKEDGLPQLGVGTSRGEDYLYSLVRRWFAGEDVLRHTRFGWLCNQHLDVYVPSIRTAIEYQGEQHEESIEHWGGIEGLKKRQELDERKRLLCAENSIRLLYVYPVYDERELKDLLLPKEEPPSEC